jgi:hypothetical protein
MAISYIPLFDKSSCGMLYSLMYVPIVLVGRKAILSCVPFKYISNCSD